MTPILKALHMNDILVTEKQRKNNMHLANWSQALTSIKRQGSVLGCQVMIVFAS